MLYRNIKMTKSIANNDMSPLTYNSSIDKHKKKNKKEAEHTPY